MDRPLVLWSMVHTLVDDLSKNSNPHLRILSGHLLSAWATAPSLQLHSASGVGPGDEVIVPAFTYASSAEVIGLLGATAVRCDVQQARLISIRQARSWRYRQNQSN